MIIQLRSTTEANLPFVLQAERDPENRPFIRQWSPEQHANAISDPNVGHYILEGCDSLRSIGYTILIGL
jgi:hypothetical protein